MTGFFATKHQNGSMDEGDPPAVPSQVSLVTFKIYFKHIKIKNRVHILPKFAKSMRKVTTKKLKSLKIH